MKAQRADELAILRFGAWWLKIGKVELIRHGLPFAEYLQLPCLSISRLKEIKRSPQHCQYFARQPKRSDALTLGSAAHCATLEPDRFASAYRIWDRRTDTGRAAPRNGGAWDEFLAEAIADGCEVLTADEAASALSIAKAVRGNSSAMRYLARGEPEVTMQWEMQGHACKARPDWLTEWQGRPALVGLKTTRDVRMRNFGRQAADLEYPQYWAWYYNGYASITATKPKVVEIVVESTAPHAVAVFDIPDEVIIKGEEEFGKSLVAFDECRRSGVWPGPIPRETELELPRWYFGDYEDDIAGMGLVTDGETEFA